MGERSTFRCARRALFVLVALFAWLGSTPAGAVPTSWVVTNPNADGTFAISDAAVVLRNPATGDVVTCSTPPSVEGSLKSGTYETDPRLGGAQLGQLRVDHDDCVDGGGAPVQVVQVEKAFSAQAYDVGAGRTSGVLRPLLWPFFWVTRPGCEYFVGDVFDAPSAFTYTNSTATLTIDSDGLRVFGVSGSGCDGVAREDDTVAQSATYTLTPAITMVGS